MGLFSYYALHTLKNQLKKLFKSWVLIFIIACFVIGALIGVFAATVSEKSEEMEAASGEVTEEFSEELPEEEDNDEEDPFGDFLEANGTDTNGFIELIAGGLILALFVVFAFNADKNGSKIFLPADVNFLFSSPMRPQSVLMFRLLTQLGMMVAASLYMVFQLPNLILNLGLSVFAAFMLLAAWFLLISVSTLLQVFLYIFASSHPRFKENLHRGVYALLLLIAGGWLLTLKTGGGGYLSAAARFFNGRYSRLIPFWGWIKGVCMYAIEGDVPKTMLCIAATVLAGAALVFFTWRIKADFYEDAMAKSEETAALLETAQREKSTGTTVRRKKDRSDRLTRDGLNRGFGANMFFYKSLYNRFRFAHFHIFTKTLETYLAAGVLMGLLCRFALDVRSEVPIVLVIAALTFFRALGNPLEQDTQSEYFLLIPENTWAKLFWSLAGGTANCFLDLLPGLVIGTLVSGGNLLLALAWIPFILSVDFYAGTTGAFIAISTPASAGKTVKQIVQIMFIYFGLLPDIFIMVIGLIFGHTALCALLSALVNLALGFLFFGLIPLFLDPPQGKLTVRNENSTADLAKGKRTFSRLGFGVFVILVLSSVLQIVVINLCGQLAPDFSESSAFLWLCTFVPLYCIGVPVGMLFLRKVPKQPPEPKKLSVKDLLTAGVISVFLMYAGNLFGMLVTTLLGKLFGQAPVNGIVSYATDDAFLLKVLFLVIAAPCIEEWIFRKTLIDRMRVWGEKTAVLTSALIFGLFHGNLSQMFYAAALGLLFGYVYLKTGKLRYTMLLHIFVNFLGSVAGPFILSLIPSGEDAVGTSAEIAGVIKGMLPLIGYAAVMIGLAAFGLVLLCIRARSVRFAAAESEIPNGKRFRTVWVNSGMILFTISCLVLVVVSFVGKI